MHSEGNAKACGKRMGRDQFNWKGKWGGRVEDRVGKAHGLEWALEDVESLREMLRCDFVGS